MRSVAAILLLLQAPPPIETASPEGANFHSFRDAGSAGTPLVSSCLGGSVRAPQVPELAADDFKRLQAEIRPQPGESPWREIAWITSIREARQKAAAEGKPIVIFTAADGSPLART